MNDEFVPRASRWPSNARIGYQRAKLDWDFTDAIVKCGCEPTPELDRISQKSFDMMKFYEQQLESEPK